MTNDYSLDIITELISIGFGRATEQLNRIFKGYIKLSLPQVLFPRNIDDRDFIDSGSEKQVFYFVDTRLEDGLDGTVSFAVSAEEALKLTTALVDKDVFSEDFDYLRISMLRELGNIILNSILFSIVEVADITVNFGLPEYVERFFNDYFEILASKEKHEFLISKIMFTANEQDYRIFIFFSLKEDKFQLLINRLSE